MDFRDRVIRLAVPLFIERPAAGRGYAGLREALTKSGLAVTERIGKATPGERSEKIARHVIGIELWGQRRLRVALGEPLEMDGHHPYKPPRGLNLEALASEFASARQQTLALLRKLEFVAPSEKIPHNGVGPLSVLGWLQYLNVHADFESKQLR